MQNGRNRIAARGRAKAGRSRKGGKGAKPPLAKPPMAKAPQMKASTPGFPRDVVVAAPPGLAVPKAFPAGEPKRRKARPHPAKHKRPGRKKRAAAREAEHRRQTALVVVGAKQKPSRPPKEVRHPVTPEVICLADASGPATALPQPEEVATALPLPEMAEPLVVAAIPLSEGGALARPSRGLVAAISAWLGSARRLLALNLLPRKARKPLPKPPRSLAEINRIAEENAAQRQRSKVDA